MRANRAELHTIGLLPYHLWLKNPLFGVASVQIDFLGGERGAKRLVASNDVKGRYDERTDAELSACERSGGFGGKVGYNAT